MRFQHTSSVSLKSAAAGRTRDACSSCLPATTTRRMRRVARWPAARCCLARSTRLTNTVAVGPGAGEPASATQHLATSDFARRARITRKRRAAQDVGWGWGPQPSFTETAAASCFLEARNNLPAVAEQRWVGAERVARCCLARSMRACAEAGRELLPPCRTVEPQARRFALAAVLTHPFDGVQARPSLTRKSFTSSV